MTDELFHTEESLSPKLVWLKKHGLMTRRINETGKWECGIIAKAASEDEAILAYCEEHGLLHWTQEGAMAALPGVSGNYASVVDNLDD